MTSTNAKLGCVCLSVCQTPLQMTHLENSWWQMRWQARGVRMKNLNRRKSMTIVLNWPLCDMLPGRARSACKTLLMLAKACLCLMAFSWLYTVSVSQKVMSLHTGCCLYPWMPFGSSQSKAFSVLNMQKSNKDFFFQVKVRVKREQCGSGPCHSNHTASADEGVVSIHQMTDPQKINLSMLGGDTN